MLRHGKHKFLKEISINTKLAVKLFYIVGEMRMTKTKILLALVLGLTSIFFNPNHALASLARQSVLGTGDGNMVLNAGSLLYIDERNIFVNPANINQFFDYAIIEKNGNSNTFTGEGGTVFSFLTFKFGFYFNRGSYIPAPPTTYNILPARAFEFFVGSDFGFKWGLGVGTATNTMTNGFSRDVNISLGTEYEDFEPFFHVKVYGREVFSGVETKHSAFKGGIKYTWGEWIPYILVSQSKEKNGAIVPSRRVWGGGIGRNTIVTSGINLYYSISGWHQNGQGTRTRAPISVGIESNAKEWLTLRAGLGHDLYHYQRGPGSIINSTTARLGASFHIEKFNIDWAFGNNADLNNDGVSDGVDAVNFGLDQGIFTLLSASYSL